MKSIICGPYTEAPQRKINMKLKLTELYGIYIYILAVHLYMFHTQNIYNSLFVS